MCLYHKITTPPRLGGAPRHRRGGRGLGLCGARFSGPRRASCPLAAPSWEDPFVHN